MLWSKQFYHYVVERMAGWRPGQPPPPNERKPGRNSDWRHLITKTSCPCRTSGNTRGTPPGTSPFTAFRSRWSIAEFAKSQLDIIVREWYQHPNGQIPAYEWNFGDVNPPVIALGRMAHLQDRAQSRLAKATALFSRRSFTKCDQLHLVGEPKDSRRQQYFPGRISRAR